MRKNILPAATVIALFVTAAIFYFIFPQPDDTPITAPRPGELVQEGTKTLIGILSPEKYRKGGPTLTTKEAIIFLDNGFFDTPAGQEAQKLGGKQVEVRGDISTRYCGGAYIQCLAQGFISKMENIQYIKQLTN